MNATDEVDLGGSAPARRQAGVALFALACSLYVLTIGGEISQGDGAIFFKVTESLVERGSLRIATTAEMEHVYGIKPGYSYFGSGFSVVSIPFYVVGRGAAALFPATPAKAVIKLIMTLANPLICALLLLASFRLAVRLGIPLRAAALAALTLMLATVMWDYSKNQLREPLAALGLLACVYELHRQAQSGRRRDGLAAGGAFVLMVWTRFELWALAPILAAFAVLAPLDAGREDAAPRVRGSAAAWFGLPLICSLPVFAAFAYVKFGQPLSLGYLQHSMTATPLGIGAPGLLTSPMHGLLIYAAPAACGLLGLPALVRRAPATGWLIGVLFGFMLVFYGKFSIWSGGFTLGPRFLFPVIPLLLLPLAAILHEVRERPFRAAAVVAVVVAGFFVQVLSVLSSWSELFGRYVQYFGNDGLHLVIARFLTSPLDDFWRQLQNGRVNLAWLRLGVLGVPPAFLAIPAAALAAFAWAALRLWSVLRPAAGDAASARGRWTPPRTLLAAGLAIVLLVSLALAAAERIGAPRGLDLLLADRSIQPAAVVAQRTGQEPLLDAAQRPIDNASPDATAIWRGVLRIPCYIYSSQLYLATNRPCRVSLNGQAIFEMIPTDPNDRISTSRPVDLGRGYYPFLVRLDRPDREAFLNLRWSIQDFAFQGLIGRDNFFREAPRGMMAALVNVEFYLLAAAALAAFFLLVLFFDARRPPAGAMGSSTARRW